MQILMLLGLRLKKSWKDTRGQGIVEYALIAAFLTVTAAAVMPGVATKISTLLNEWHLQYRGPGFKRHGSHG